ncbi:hypothetical protein [Rhizobium sp. Root482]|uniref:hypothetical protein n=1 Tax=Rhizobium sp. Root482 TaxID=1736543 RepID=UPI0012E33E5C|nr:hypothetical protein [Rhizobium sp. Root482]
MSDGVELIHFLGGSLEQSIRNRMRRKTNSQVIGAPVVSADYLTFKGDTNWLKTAYRDTAALTFIAVARTSDTLADNNTRPTLIGTSDGLGNSGASLYAGTAGRWRQNAYYLDGTPVSQVQDNVATMTTWRLVIGVVNTSGVSLYDLTDGDGATATPPSSTRVLGGQAIGIGGNYGATTKGTCDMAFAAVLSRAMTDADERTAWLNALRAAFADTSVSF